MMHFLSAGDDQMDVDDSALVDEMIDNVAGAVP